MTQRVVIDTEMDFRSAQDKNKDNSNMRIEEVKITWLATPWFANLPNIWRRQKSAKSCHNGQILQKSNSQSAEVCATKLIKNRWFFPVHESRRRQNDCSSLRVKKKFKFQLQFLIFFYGLTWCWQLCTNKTNWTKMKSKSNRWFSSRGILGEV